MLEKEKYKRDELDESPELAQALVRCAGTGIYIVQDGKFQYANDLFQEMTGYSVTELVGKRSLDIVYPADREKVRAKAIESLKGGSAFPYEYRFVKKSGEIGWVLEKVTSAKYKDKRAAVGSFLDITERKLAEEKLLDSQARYRSIVETGNAGVFVGDLNGNITFVNDAFCNMLGYSREELQNKPFANFIHPDERALVLEKFAQGLANPEAIYSVEIRAVRKDGHVIWVYPSVSPIFYKNVLTSGIAILFDITERKKLEDVVKKSEERYRTILDEIQDSYFEVDLAGNFTFVNDAMCRSMGYSEEEVIGTNFSKFAAKDDVDVIYRDFNRVYKTGETLKGLAYRFIQKNGTVGFGELSISAIKSEEGKVIAFRGLARDVTERKLMEQQLSDIARHDFLTGLPNRVSLHDRLNVELAHAKRDGANLAVMMLDLDNFKLVNDTYGHGGGDKLLQAAAERLATLIRKSDTVARIGGDEFLILLPRVAKIDNAAKVAQKIITAFRKPFVVDSYQIRVTASIGIAIYPEDGEEGDALVSHADIAMYWVKGQGRNSYTFYSADKVQVL